jgi:hypothetical protein
MVLATAPSENGFACTWPTSSILTHQLIIAHSAQNHQILLRSHILILHHTQIVRGSQFKLLHASQLAPKSLLTLLMGHHSPSHNPQATRTSTSFLLGNIFWITPHWLSAGRPNSAFSSILLKIIEIYCTSSRYRSCIKSSHIFWLVGRLCITWIYISGNSVFSLGENFIFYFWGLGKIRFWGI